MYGCLLALQFLTTLPVRLEKRASDREVADSLKYFPVVGAVLGMLLVLIYQLLSLVFASSLVALFLVIALVMLTGALHIDGLLDSCDGLFGWRTPERRLEIMRDSRVGSFGVAGGWALLSLKYAGLSLVIPELMPQALLIAPVLGRWALVLGVAIFPYGRTTGYGSPYKQYFKWLDFILATVTTLFLSWLVFRIPGLVLAGIIFVLTIVIGRWIMTKLPDGLTGDNYGFITEIAETVIWLIIQASPGLIRLWL